MPGSAAARALPTGALLIGDEWVTNASGGLYEHVYAGNSQVNATIELAGAVEVDRAVRAAWSGHHRWMALNPEQRRDLLLALADAVAAQNAELADLNVHALALPTIISPFHGQQVERFLRFYGGYKQSDSGRVGGLEGFQEFQQIKNIRIAL